MKILKEVWFQDHFCGILFTFFHPNGSCTNTTIDISLLPCCLSNYIPVLFWVALSECFTEAQLAYSVLLSKKLGIFPSKNTSLACHGQSLGFCSVFLTCLCAFDNSFHQNLF